MMHAALSILTLSTMLLHVLLGCCAHHAHPAADGSAVTLAVPELNSHHGECPHHRHLADNGACDRHGAPAEDDCDEPSCTFVGVSKVELPAPTVGLVADFADVDAFRTALLSRALGTQGEVPIDRGRAVAVRLHALHRVWLV